MRKRLMRFSLLFASLSILVALVALAINADPTASRSGSSRPGLEGARPGDVLAHLDATVSVPPHLPSDCIPQRETQIQLGVYATFSGSLAINAPVGPEAAASVSGSFCGIATVVNAPPGQCRGETVAVKLFIPADGQNFALPGVKLTLVPGITPEVTDTHIVPAPITTFVCASPAPGAIKLNLTVSVSTSASLFGATCVVGPVTLPLTGTLFGPLGGFTFEVGSHSFAIPAANPSVDCPSDVTAQLNQLLDFPLPSGTSIVSLTGNGTAYYVPNP